MEVKNPADIPSRETSPMELLLNATWRDGPSIPPPSVWTFEDEGVQSEESMVPDCVAELHASEKHSIVGFLTRDAHGVSNIVRIEDFIKVNRLFVTQVLKYCSIPKKKVNPDCHNLRLPH